MRALWLVMRAGVFLVIGLFITIAVALSLGWLARLDSFEAVRANQPMEAGEFGPEPGGTGAVLIGPPGIMVMRLRGFGAEEIRIVRNTTTHRWAGEPSPEIETVWPRWGAAAGCTPREMYESLTAADDWAMAMTARGWPMLALWCELVDRPGKHPGGVRLGRAHQENSFYVQDLVLPLRPVWSGLVVNSLACGAAAWVICAGLIGLRGWNRQRRGLCSVCAYPVGVDPVCTECGAPTRRLDSIPRSHT